MRNWLLGIGAAAVLTGCMSPAFAAEETVRAPVATRIAKESGTKTAVFAGGCFWGAEDVFSHVKGVTSVVSGYSGGARSTAKYDTVSGGDTGHAESVRITYDPSRIRYDQLLRILYSVVADPTLRNRQGPDVGSQYRSAIFPQSAEQKAVAQAYLQQLQKAGVWSGTVVADVEPFKGFYPAESYHQNFAAKNPGHPYIRRWDDPKVAALKSMYPGVYRADFLRD